MIVMDETYPSEVVKSRIGLMTYLSPKGDLLELNSIDQLKSAIDDCIDSRETHIVVDMVMVQRINSHALEMFLDAHDELLKIGGWIKLAQVEEHIKKIFLITNLLNTIQIVNPDGRDVSKNIVPPSEKKRLGDILVEKGFVTEKQVDDAIDLQKKLNRRMGRLLVEKGWVAEKDMMGCLSLQLGIPYIKLTTALHDSQILSSFDKTLLQRLKVLPLFRVRDTLFLATSDPQDFPVLDEIKDRVRCNVRPVIAQSENILEVINDVYGADDFSSNLLDDVDDDFEVVESTVSSDYEAIDEMAAGSPVINMINSIIQRAVFDGASDIHIEPSRTKSRVRFRIDGILYEILTPRVELHPALVSRLKVMANLDISERRLPQDGRIQVHTQGRSVDLRFSSLPGLYGEKVVLRVLDKNQSILDVEKLGFSDSNLHSFKDLLTRSYGLILVTGPTGSGKTTSLYAALNYLNSIEKNIVTIEDPVEYQLDIINQNEVRDKIDLSFAKVLKHVLRQDPDIIMVGEIRERETAEIAVQAALTGHLVLSTLHTNDSVGAITRLLDMGVEPFMLSSALIGVVAQRLVRCICPACKTSYLAPPELAERYHWNSESDIRLSKGRGCSECYDSGYKGRMAIHEVIKATDELQKLIVSCPSRDQLSNYLQQNKVETLFDDGLLHARNGETTIEEIMRVINN
ncbi:MAG: ATPase, T2SS/T4P/T4SS family [Gammaproteobacteria bacterium]|nr:ATPase, T2SS/T4P/T4SS family [Gammaproteobacteria bacterium]